MWEILQMLSHVKVRWMNFRRHKATKQTDPEPRSQEQNDFFQKNQSRAADAANQKHSIKWSLEKNEDIF